MRHDQALLFQALAMGGATANDIITTGEKMAQTELVSSASIPVKGNSYGSGDTEWDVLTKWGVKVLKPEDKWMWICELPPGWKKERTDHSMWSNLVDNQGRVRATMFYKSTFGFTEDAFVSTSTRFSTCYERDDWDDEKAPYIPVIKDGGKIVWRGTGFTGETHDAMKARYAKCREISKNRGCKGDPIPKDKSSEYARYERLKNEFFPDPSDLARRRAAEVLKGLAPDYGNVLAHWDDTIVFPAWESHPPTDPFYTMDVAIYRDGNHVDSGRHCEKRYATKEAAIAGLTEKARNVLGGYDEVRFTIRDKATGAEVHRGTVESKRRRQPKMMAIGPDGWCDYEYDERTGMMRSNGYPRRR